MSLLDTPCPYPDCRHPQMPVPHERGPHIYEDCPKCKRGALAVFSKVRKEDGTIETQVHYVCQNDRGRNYVRRSLWITPEQDTWRTEHGADAFREAIDAGIMTIERFEAIDKVYSK